MPIGRFLCGIAALIRSPETGRYLLLRRSPDKDYGAGAWECVTGRVDQGEGFEDALHREVREELDACVRITFIVGTTHFFRGAPVPENELLGVVYCCALADDAPLCLSAEHTEYRWATAQEALSFLTDADASTLWLRRVIARAEALASRYPPDLGDPHGAEGLELG